MKLSATSVAKLTLFVPTTTALIASPAGASNNIERAIAVPTPATTNGPSLIARQQDLNHFDPYIMDPPRTVPYDGSPNHQMRHQVLLIRQFEAQILIEAGKAQKERAAANKYRDKHSKKWREHNMRHALTHDRLAEFATIREREARVGRDNATAELKRLEAEWGTWNGQAHTGGKKTFGQEPTKSNPRITETPIKNEKPHQTSTVVDSVTVTVAASQPSVAVVTATQVHTITAAPSGVKVVTVTASS